MRTLRMRDLTITMTGITLNGNRDFEDELSIHDASHDLRCFFVTHKDSKVRLVAARRKFGLDVLIEDECEDVRIQVAKQGYGLDTLINNPCAFVRLVASEKRKELGIS